MMSRGMRPRALVAIVGVLLAAGAVAGGCGDQGSAGSPATTSAPATSPTAPGSPATTSAQTTTSAPATTPAPSTTAASGLGENRAGSGEPAWQVTEDDTAAGSTVVTRFLDAVNARDFTSASELLAPDAVLQVEEVTSRVRRITLTKSPILLVPDEQGPAQLAVTARGTVDVVAAQGSDLRSAVYGMQVGLRRESRRDEWRVWSFDLQPQ